MNALFVFLAITAMVAAAGVALWAALVAARKLLLDHRIIGWKPYVTTKSDLTVVGVKNGYSNFVVARIGIQQDAEEYAVLLRDAIDEARKRSDALNQAERNARKRRG